MSAQQFSRDQDSLDNIVVEDDFNQSEDVDSLHSFAAFEESAEKTDFAHEELELEAVQEDGCYQYGQSLTILKKIAAKSSSIFKLLSRSEFNQKELESTKNNSQQTKSQVLKREILNYSRREKSLEELSKKFLSLFLDKAESLLSLDKITSQLGVERRRIYDIINILESLKLVSRKGKNNYKWNGFQRIYDTIHYYDAREMTKKEEMELAEECPQKREKSLEMLSIGFLQLFLHFKKTMTLEEAARKLSSKTIDDHKIKTKIRRLYDIANVFKSLGLIQKTSLTDTKKPAFCWVGINGLDQFAEKIMHEKGSSAQELIHSEAYLQDGNTGIDDDDDQRIDSKECTKKVKLSNSNNMNASTNSNVSQKRYQLKKSCIMEQQEKERAEKERILNVFSQSSQQLLQTLTNAITSNTNSTCSQNSNNLCNNSSTNNELGCGDLLNNLMAKCLHNMLSNYLTKLTQPAQQQQQQQLQQTLLQQHSSLQLTQSILSKSNSDITNNSFSLNQQEAYQESPERSNPSNSTNLNKNSSRLLNPSINQKNNNSLSFDDAFLTAKKPRTDNSFTNNNYTSTSSHNNNNNNTKQTKDSAINDENIPLNMSSLNGGVAGAFTNNSHTKTPVVKRTVNTIIQPRMDEYNTTEESITTTPGVKRSFSAVVPSGQDGLFTDRTNSFLNSSKQISSTNNGFQQHSSFKKIRKLTYDNFSSNDSANKTTGGAQQMPINESSENTHRKLQQQQDLDALTTAQSQTQQQQQQQQLSFNLNALLSSSSQLTGSGRMLERFF